MVMTGGKWKRASFDSYSCELQFAELYIGNAPGRGNWALYIYPLQTGDSAAARGHLFRKAANNLTLDEAKKLLAAQYRKMFA